MLRSGLNSRFFLIAIILFAFVLDSCKTTRNIAGTTARPIGTAKLLENVEENAFDYEYFEVKRINCQFSDNNTKTTFKIGLKAHKDQKILVSISKMNIPVGRVLLTPDSVKYVNYIDRNFFVDDYTYLSDFLNIDLDFATVQSIISHNVFSYRNDPRNRDFKTFDSFVEEGMHVLQSEKERKLFKLNSIENPEKVQRRLRRLDDEALIVQKMYFDPVNFTLHKLIIEDKSNQRTMEANFSDFERINRKEYPGSMDMQFTSERNHLQLKVRLSSFSTEKINSFNVRIPSKYEQISVN